METLGSDLENQAETLAVRLETLKLAERQKGCMVRQTDSVKGHLNNSSLEVQNVNNEKGERLKEFKDEFSEFRKYLISLTKEIKGLSQTHKYNGRQGGDNQQGNYQNGQRSFNDQNRNSGK